MNNSEEFDIQFNFVRFIKFLQENNIIGVIIASVLSDRVNELTNIFFNDIVMPVINRDGDGDGVKDIKNFEEHKISMFGAKFGVGKFVVTLFKFIIVTYLIFIISNALKKWITKID